MNGAGYNNPRVIRTRRSRSATVQASAPPGGETVLDDALVSTTPADPLVVSPPCCGNSPYPCGSFTYRKTCFHNTAFFHFFKPPAKKKRDFAFATKVPPEPDRQGPVPGTRSPPFGVARRLVQASEGRSPKPFTRRTTSAGSRRERM